MATNEWDDVNKPLPGPLPKPSRVPPLSTLYDKATTGTSAATDVARTLLGGPVAAVGGAWQGPLQALSAGPGYLYRKYAEGDPQGAEEYWKQNVKPAEENMYSMYKRLAEPSTKQVKQFEEDFAAAFEASKLPPVFPGLTSGIPVRGITPTDVRVMGYNAKRIGSQVRDIPTDFRNAQSGLQRIDPVTGEPTLGVKLQGTAESIGNTLERQADARIARTDMSSMSPLSALMPDTSMYAVRPTGSRILRAKVPEGGAPFTDHGVLIGRLDPLSIYLDERVGNTDLSNSDRLLDAYMTRYLDNADIHTQGVKKFLQQRAIAKYPDAPNVVDAIDALQKFHGGVSSKAMANEELAAIDDYVKSPEAAAAISAGAPPIPTVNEFLERNKESEKWRTTNLPNFITKYLGTEADPALVLATQGLTFKNPADLIEESNILRGTALSHRRASGMPKTGAVQSALDKKESELYNAEQEMHALGNTAHPDDQRAALNKVTNLRKEIENLKIGAAYENIADASIVPHITEDIRGALDFADRQFFPSLVHETNPKALQYKLLKSAISRLGFSEIAKLMHEDILNGTVPINKVQNMTVDKYIKKKAEARIAAEAAEQAKAQAYIEKVTDRFAGMAQNLPSDAIKLDNAYVLESTKDTPMSEVLQRASDDTGVLDHCVGQGGSGSRSDTTVHPFTGLKKRNYEPMFMLDEPGINNPNASSYRTTYTTLVGTGENILGHVRDAQTGMPVATIQLERKRQRDGTQGYTLNYVSGPADAGGTNGPVEPKYNNAIRDYLNQYADKIGYVQQHLIDNTRVRDTTSTTYDDVGVEAGYRDNRDLRADNPDLPRFITLDDARAIRDGTYQMPEPTARSTALVTQSAVPAPVTPEDLRAQVTDFANDVLEELHRARVGYFDPDDVAQILAPLVDRHDFSLGVGPLIDQIDRAANTQPNAIAAELMDFAQYLREGQHVPAGRAVAPVPAPGITQNVGDEIATFLDFMHEDLAQDLGQDVADRATQIANRALVDQLPNGVPALIADLRDRASVYGNPDVAGALNRIAQGIEQGDHQVAALGDFEPEVPHPANSNPQAIAQYLVDIERRPDGTLSTEGLTNTAFALLHGQLDYPGFTRIPPGPERARAMEPILTAFRDTIADALGFPITEPEVAQEPIGQSLLRTPYNELQQMITPAERALLNIITARITRLASDYGVSGAEVADMIRNRSQTYGGLTVNLDHFSPQALEVLARDTSDSIEAQNRAHDRRPRQ